MVISTGSKTYMALIAKDLAKKRPLNGMQLGVRRVSYILLAFMGVSELVSSISYGAECNR
jgi:Mg2+-importing ATPase